MGKDLIYVYGTGNFEEDYITFGVRKKDLLADYDDYERFIKHCEDCVRKEDRYTAYVKEMKEAGLTRCAILGNIEEDNKVKLESIEHFIPTISPDSLKFWADYMDEVNILLDSRKFGKECADLGIDPTVLATHIIFLGVGTRNKVLKNGIKNTIGNDYHMYDKQFLPEEAMKFELDYKPEKPTDSENVSTDTAA